MGSFQIYSTLFAYILFYSNIIDHFKYYYLLVNGQGPRQMYDVLV